MGKTHSLLATLAASEPRSLRLALHHMHLPKLEDYGVLVYDADARRIQQA
ncbi:DUF7344 domain-containing protein [Salinarchaeum chitinilyticum]